MVSPGSLSTTGFKIQSLRRPRKIQINWTSRKQTSGLEVMKVLEFCDKLVGDMRKVFLIGTGSKFVWKPANEFQNVKFSQFY